MSTTSFNASQAGYRQPVGNPSSARTQDVGAEKQPAHLRHADEIQRMKNFAGRRRFQAPVADDFARGMLAPGQAREDGRPPLAQFRGALASVIVGLKALCGGQKVEGPAALDTRKPD